MRGWSLSGRSNPGRSRPARHQVRYARPYLEVLEARNVLSTMYPGIMSFAPVVGPTIQAYSPLDNVIQTYGDGFQTITGAYAPESSATNNTGLFAIDNGGTSVTVSASNTAAAFELGSGNASTNTQLPVAASSIALLTTTPFGNNGGTLLEVPSGENAFFGLSSGVGAAFSSLVTPFTPYVTLADLPMENVGNLIGLSLQSTSGPVAPGLSTDPTQGGLGSISQGFLGSINALQLPVRTPPGLSGGGGGDIGVAQPLDQQLQQDQQLAPQGQPMQGQPMQGQQSQLKLEMLNHMSLISWDDLPASQVEQQPEEEVVQAARPFDALLLPPLLAEMSLRDPVLQVV